ncbi:MAG TPA: type VI secretion system tip protein VgrG [Gemmatimonadaceae bacterium]|nr:type VI secretion system tip protein VgrG [Gemmatimonadaceae bacterium]
MSDYTQDDRLLKVSTPLGKDTLLLTGFSGSEGISMPFRFDLSLCALSDAQVDAKKLIAQPMTITIADAEGDVSRHINGVVSSFAQTGSDSTFVWYRAQLVPTLSLLTRRADIRIFQQKTVTDVIEAVFKDANIEYDLNITGSYQPLDYCVQYRETDFAFVSRLMEEYGIFYYFKHTESKHTLVVADASSAHQTVPGQSSARFHSTASGSSDVDVVSSWELVHEFRAGKYTLTDYNFETPSTSLSVSEPTTIKLGDNDAYELYDFPGAYGKKGDGDTLARVRMQEQEARVSTASGSGSCRAFTPGYRFTLSEHPQSANNGSYVLTVVSHSGSNGSYIAGNDGSSPHYWNTFNCIPFETPYRPERVTPRPAAYGLQSAVVVGSGGEEIWVDKYGRVKVQFFWDRLGKDNEQSSCWVRVAQPWAGKQWGFVAWPRIGQEVLVAFESGDPDRPIIVGSLYNAEQMPPYELPANQTQTGIKTHSSKGGGSDNFNELRFEDKKGSEMITVQAEKDLSTVVKNNETREVRNTRTTTIQSDDVKTIKKGKDETTLDEGDHSTMLKKGTHSLILQDGKSQVWLQKGDKTLDMDDGSYSADLTQGNHKTHLANGDHSIEIDVGDMKVAVHTGDQKTVCDAGSISFEALEQIELKVGGNSVKISQQGITISGMMVSIEGQIQCEMKGMMTSISADAMLQAKGAITMIN